MASRRPLTRPGTGARVVVKYWAGARAAAGTDEDTVVADTVGDAVTAANDLHEGLAAVTAVSSLLVSGRTVGRDHSLSEGDVVEVLPPFAGG